MTRLRSSSYGGQAKSECQRDKGLKNEGRRDERRKDEGPRLKRRGGAKEEKQKESNK